MAILDRRDAAGKGLTHDGKVLYAVVVNYRDYRGRRRQIRRHAEGIHQARATERELYGRRDLNDLPDMLPPPEGTHEGAPETTAADDTPQEPARLTVADYVERWLKGRRSIRASTLARYRVALEPLVEAVGHVPLEELTPLQIQDVYDSIRASGRQEHNCHRTLRKAMRDAMRLDLITRNPVDRVEAPSMKPVDLHIMSRKDLDALIQCADKTPFGPIVRFAAWTGLRLGEILALTWDDLNLDAAKLTVRRSLNAVGDVSEVKTKRSRRTISLSPATVTLLREIRRMQREERLAAGPAYKENDLVFADPLGGHRPQHIVDGAWRRIRTDAKVPKARFHDLRHAHASHLLADGWDLASVSERLGHAQIAVTLAFYAHSIPGRDAALAGAIDRIFGAAKGTSSNVRRG